MLLRRILYLILCGIIILSSTAKAASEPFPDQDTILEAGQVAPFHGVLVPDEHYRTYTEDMQLADYVAKDAKVDVVAAAKPDHTLYWGLGGAFVGLVVGILISH